MTETKPAPSKRRKFIVPFVTAAMAMLFGATIFMLPPPISKQLHTTSAKQYEQVFVGTNIRIDMNTNSSITVSTAQPPEIELLQGSIYLDITNSGAANNKLIAFVDNARIRNIGTRFSLKKQGNGGSVAVADGQVEIQIGNQSRIIDAGQHVVFENTQITEESTINSTDIAPWRHNK